MKLIRKLIVGISTICLLVMTFVSATYAWFEINSRASVENFRFEMVGGQGFLVSIDNVNYYNDLSMEQIQKAMLVSYRSNEYKLADDGSEDLFKKSYDSVSGAEEWKIIGKTQINADVIEYIKLLPVTTHDGRNFYDRFETDTTSVTLGRFAEFGVYFRAESRKNEGVTYEIYLNGKDDGNTVVPTMITSEITDVPLSADMNAIFTKEDGSKYVKSLKRINAYGQQDHINVYSSNALRLSITNQEYYVEYQKDATGQYSLDENGNKIVVNEGYKLAETSPTKIYELNDTVNKNTDLGSYATDYDGGKSDGELESIITNGSVLEDENLALYCSKFNAMYNYYNNLKPEDNLTNDLPSFENKPVTITDLSNEDIITTVTTGEEAKLLTFRLWLEGWDADCFDGLSKAVSVRLAFGSKKKEIGTN